MKYGLVLATLIAWGSVIGLSGSSGPESKDAAVVGGGLVIPIGSMYGIFTYIWLKSMVNVGKTTIHESYGI